ncbi:Tetracycline resistance protein, class C [Gammaproteobacteria bacterium]|nr:MFS transporter [Gammaproteobacteria bacterium]QOJ32148.1 MAG: MFS transporter [Gammaproteobacteria bacterium]CAG0945576.1 Tetracycline resistance protein, class C [Gammaproteobacteria bacterium]
MPILLATVVLSGLGFGLVLPGMPFVAENLGASPALATFILGLYAWGQFFATTLWGRLSDRFGRKPILVITNGGVALAYLLMALAPNVWVLAAARALTGLMGGLAPAMAYVADVTPSEKRAQGMGWVGAATSFGFVIGPALGGLLGGEDAGSASLLMPGLAAFGIAAAATLATLFLLPESLPPEKRVQPAARGAASGEAGVGLRQLLHRPLMARLLVLGFGVYVAMAMFETIFAFWAKARFGWGPREVGLTFTYLAMVVGLMQGFVVGRFAPRLGEGRLAIAGLTSYALGLLVMTQAPRWEWMMLGVTLTAGGGGTFLTSMSSFVSRLAGAGERGLVLGTYQSASWGGRSVGPALSGAMFNSLGADSPLLAGALVMMPCIALLVTITNRSCRDGIRSPG